MERCGISRPGFTEADYAALIDIAVAARPWLTVYRPLPYAHELNPVEPVWAQLKRSLAYLTEHAIAELTVLVKTRLRRVRYHPGLLVGSLASTGAEFGRVCTPRAQRSRVVRSMFREEGSAATAGQVERASSSASGVFSHSPTLLRTT